MERYESWIERAKSSLELAQAKIIRHIHYEDLCFQLQQAAEKALKGLLIYYGVEPEFTHNIEILLKEIKNFTDIPKNIKEAVQLTNYAVQTRYPGEYDEITKEEYENSIKIASLCLDWVENKIKETEENKKPE
ncbi:MAG: HEPN domain-containing protein [Dysgonamonadaceae bacterium]|jgi:HEPN domain-containing protein|nr:HEPN domain-containing protein [Dysgonamonadaceae bacterium]